MIVSEISSHSCVVSYPTAHSREAFKMDRDSQCDWEMARKQEAGAPLLGLCRGQGQEPGKAGWVVAAVKGRGPCTEILRPKQEKGPTGMDPRPGSRMGFHWQEPRYRHRGQGTKSGE